MSPWFSAPSHEIKSSHAGQQPSVGSVPSRAPRPYPVPHLHPAGAGGGVGCSPPAAHLHFLSSWVGCSHFRAFQSHPHCFLGELSCLPAPGLLSYWRLQGLFIEKGNEACVCENCRCVRIYICLSRILKEQNKTKKQTLVALTRQQTPVFMWMFQHFFFMTLRSVFLPEGPFAF